MSVSHNYDQMSQPTNTTTTQTKASKRPSRFNSKMPVVNSRLAELARITALLTALLQLVSYASGLQTVGESAGELDAVNIKKIWFWNLFYLNIIEN